MRRRKRRLIPAEQGWHAMEASMQPPISQYEEGLLHSQNPKEVKLAPLLARADLLITRDIEWANIMFAFEQLMNINDPSRPTAREPLPSEAAESNRKQLLHRDTISLWILNRRTGSARPSPDEIPDLLRASIGFYLFRICFLNDLIQYQVGTSLRELMRWLKNLSLLPRFANGFSGFGLSVCRAVNECLNSAFSIQKIANIGQYGEVHQDGLWHPAFSGHLGSGSAVMSFLARAMPGDRTLKLQHESGIEANMLQAHSTIGHKYRKFIRQEHSVSRDWLAKRWVADKRKKEIMRRRKRRLIPAEQGWHAMEASMQPPISQYEEGLLHSQNPKEVKLAPLLARADLLITRDIEWANIMFAFEQENRYAVVDPCYPQSPVGFIHEQSNIITRQLLRTRRPFIAYIIDAMGNEIFRVRRPFWWITSTIYTEVDGKEVGIVRRRWHLWRRIYDLYLGNKQFAVVENPGLWNWTFTLKDEDDNVLAQIDRDWRGFGLELFTDAGQYVIRFGNAYSIPKIGLASAVQELQVSRPLTLLERAVAVALAISLDNDFFSRTVGGWGLPIIVAGE